jgi:pyruvate kinase
MRRTKIVATLGPASSGPETIGDLLDAGVNVVRMNFSHGAHDGHAESMRHVRNAAAARDSNIAIIADLQGPKIRTGRLAGGLPISLKVGSEFRLTTREIEGDANGVSVDYDGLPDELTPGDKVLLADGAIELQVKATDGQDVVCEVVSGGTLGERKGVNLPGAEIKLPSMTKKDEVDLTFALNQGVDYVALSFVRKPEDVLEARRRIREAGSDVKLIAKIEKPQALDKLAEILAAADGVMVARGDLGVELSPWIVPMEQKRIIREAASMRKPVITATQMLESMMHNPRPTRAEASDVANAVIDGSDAVMLSGETAVGKYPVEAVRMMSNIIEAAESSLPHTDLAAPIARDADLLLSDAVANSAVEITERVGARCLVIYSESGFSARLLSKHRPRCPILALSVRPETSRLMALYWGVETRSVEPYEHVDDLVPAVDPMLIEMGWAESGDPICFVAGTPLRVKGKTDLIKVHRVGEG